MNKWTKWTNTPHWTCTGFYTAPNSWFFSFLLDQNIFSVSIHPTNFFFFFSQGCVCKGCFSRHQPSTGLASGKLHHFMTCLFLLCDIYKKVLLAQSASQKKYQESKESVHDPQDKGLPVCAAPPRLRAARPSACCHGGSTLRPGVGMWGWMVRAGGRWSKRDVTTDETFCEHWRVGI